MVPYEMIDKIPEFYFLRTKHVRKLKFWFSDIHNQSYFFYFFLIFVNFFKFFFIFMNFCVKKFRKNFIKI